jgi:hypothetical protein
MRPLTPWQNFATTQRTRPDSSESGRTAETANPLRRLQGHVTHHRFWSSRQGSSPPSRTKQTNGAAEGSLLSFSATAGFATSPEHRDDRLWPIQVCSRHAPGGAVALDSVQ